MKTSFVLHLDSLCVLEKMTEDQAGRFIKAIYQYQKTKDLPELDLLLEMAITPFINQFLRDEKQYEKVIERNRKNGEKGGRPKKEPKKPIRLKNNPNNPNNPEEPKKADSDKESVSDSVKEKVRDNVLISAREHEKLVKDNGEELTNQAYDYLHDYKIEKKYKTHDDYLSIKRWVIAAVLEKQQRNGTHKQTSTNGRVNGHPQGSKPGRSERNEKARAEY